MKMAAEGVSRDTSHLYEGKVVRAAAPSRKKLAAKMTSSQELPDDAIPEVHIPSLQLGEELALAAQQEHQARWTELKASRDTNALWALLSLDEEYELSEIPAELRAVVAERSCAMTTCTSS